MKKIIDWLKFGTGVSICLMIAFFISIFILKARQSSSSGVTVDNSSPASLYVGNNETLTSAKRNRLVQKITREEVATSDTALFDINCDRKWHKDGNVFNAIDIWTTWTRLINITHWSYFYVKNDSKNLTRTSLNTTTTRPNLHIRKKCP